LRCRELGQASERLTSALFTGNSSTVNCSGKLCLPARTRADAERRDRQEDLDRHWRRLGDAVKGPAGGVTRPQWIPPLQESYGTGGRLRVVFCLDEALRMDILPTAERQFGSARSDERNCSGGAKMLMLPGPFSRKRLHRLHHRQPLWLPPCPDRIASTISGASRVMRSTRFT
jgi:hypothetical protein